MILYNSDMKIPISNLIYKNNNKFINPQKIESKMGREKHSKKYQPRIIDIDILSYNKLILDNQNLCIPHSKIKFRKFILKPWTDIAPDYILPNSKSTIKELLTQIYDSKDIVKEYC